MIRGVNLQPSYYNGGNVTFGWDLLQTYRNTITAVRIEIEPDKVKQAAGWIQQAAQKGYSIIATYHKYQVLGSDNVNDLLDASRWWVNNYRTLSQGGSFTVNLMNEWGSHSQTASTFSSAYNQAITELRKVYSGDVIVDIAGWGQETKMAAQASPLLTDTKIVYSAHVYPSGWDQGAMHSLRPSDMDVLASSGRPCILGEFGTIGSGPVDVSAVVSRAKQIGFKGIYAWAWNGDGGDMNMASPAWYNDATASKYVETQYFQQVYPLLK
jgi:hypothetical protein